VVELAITTIFEELGKELSAGILRQALEDMALSCMAPRCCRVILQQCLAIVPAEEVNALARAQYAKLTAEGSAAMFREVLAVGGPLGPDEWVVV
jgi:hypothetical protein